MAASFALHCFLVQLLFGAVLVAAQQAVIKLDAAGPTDRPADIVGYSRAYGVVTSIANTSNDALYSRHRYGKDFSYVFTLPVGVSYDIRLYIAEPYSGACKKGGRIYSIYAYDDVSGVASGKSLNNLDVFSLVGCKVATILTLDGVALTTGKLRIQFKASIQNAMVSGFDVLSSDPSLPSPTPENTSPPSELQVNCGGGANDQLLPNTRTNSAPSSATVTSTANIEMAPLRTIRAGKDFTYVFSLPPASYTVRLGFAEVYWRYCMAAVRVFDVYVNGALELSKFDVWSESGGCYKGVERQFSMKVLDGSGPFTIRFKSVSNNAMVSYIGIFPEGGSGPAPSVSSSPTPSPSSSPVVEENTPTPTPTSTTMATATASSTPTQSPMAASTPSATPSSSPSGMTPTTDMVTINVGSTGDINVAGSTKYSSSSTFSGTTDIGSNAFKTGRTGTEFTYSFDLAPGAYDIILGFAEYQSSLCTEPGQRVFNVFVNGDVQLEGLDLHSEGCFKGLQEKITSSVGAVDTQPITIRFEAIVGEAIISYIKIEPAADACVPASTSGGLAPGEDHAAHAVPGSYPPQLSASSPKSYVDGDGDGFVAVDIDGAGSHSHFFDAANNIIGVITEYKWSIVETGEVISTSQKFRYRFPLGTTRLRLSVIDNSCTTDEAETTVTVTGAQQPGQYCYYYTGLSSSLTGATPVAQAPYPKFAAVSSSLNLGFPSFSFDNTLFTARCFFFLEVDEDSEVSEVGVTTAGTGDARIYKGADLFVDTKAADTMQTSLSVGLTAFEVIYERTTTTKAPVLQFRVNNTIPANGKVFHDRRTVVPILAALSPADGADAGGTNVKVTGYGLFQPLTVTFGSTTVTPTSTNPTQFFVNSPPASSSTAAITATTTNGLSSNSLIFSYGSSCDSVSFQETAVKKPNGDDIDYLNLPTCATIGGDGKIYMGTLAATVQVLGYDHTTLTATSHCYSKPLVDMKYTKNGVPAQRDALGIIFDPRDTTMSPYLSTATLFWFDKYRIDSSNKGAWRNGAVDRLKPGTDASDSKVCLVYDKRIISGLPISNHDHGANAMFFTQDGDLLVSVGGFTNLGLPAYKLGNYWETTLSAAILSFKLSKGAAFDGDIKYSDEDTPRLAKKISGDVEIFSTGLRNAFGMCITSTGDYYAADQGPNCNFGNSATNCSDYDEAAAAAYNPFAKTTWPGKVKHGFTNCPYSLTRPDKILHLTKGSFYGHPNLQRGGEECAWIDPFDDKTNNNLPPPPSYKKEMTSLKSPVTGIAEYRSNHFCGKLRGELILSTHNNGKTYRMGVSGSTKTSGPDQISPNGGITFVENAHGDLLFPRLTAQKVFAMRPSVAPKASLYVANAIPWRHGKAGGTKVMVGGQNFGTSPTVTIDGATCDVTASSDTEITCIVPAASSGGLKDLEVSSDGVSVILPEAVLYMNV
ncbi:hypothetical protein BWQ96_02409 [Gracilariopsis chorda]|uniref:IPT/TIG domain-containing protein n=1 Tax=Gracilariopsis chorda TaxID=448386 RepID=A0A2V3J1A1_9FLOR|nr:hypothetical protein BWQ96_02409 [Gracilariopsis chorda]|eukprot:PXF47727.1 hypothetical protein BWQ96_02409 [Gracilariopsis chorda]